MYQREAVRLAARLDTWLAVWQLNVRELNGDRVGAWHALFAQCKQDTSASAASRLGR